MKKNNSIALDKLFII